MRRRVLVGTLVALLLPGAAQAQSCTANKIFGFFWLTCNINTSASITIGTVMQLSLSGTTTALTPPTIAGYTTGYVPNAGPTVTVRCNQAWHLQVAAAAATWTAVAPARVNKPASDLQWSLAANGTFAGLTTAAVTVTNGTATAGTVTNFFYRTLYSFSLDTPGNYSLAVVYTLISP
ncbi:MAG TPA: hypothetical protein VMH88_14055 [Gemmatimonadales bacterium]|nr:hypothetical protein [Gemmatimonadales bacterium]